MVLTSPARSGSGGSPNLANDKYNTPSSTNHFRTKPLINRANARPAEYAGPIIERQARTKLPNATAAPPNPAAKAACQSFARKASATTVATAACSATARKARRRLAVRELNTRSTWVQRRRQKTSLPSRGSIAAGYAGGQPKRRPNY